MRGVDGLAAILSADTWKRLSTAGISRVFEPGRVLVDQGEQADHFVVILDGRVKIAMIDGAGNTLMLAIRGPGELIGELGVLQPDHRRTATVTAIDRCSTRLVSLDEFATVTRDLGLERHILEHVAVRLRAGETIRADLSVQSAGGRVLRTLLRLAVPNRRVPAVDTGRERANSGNGADEGDGSIDIRISQAELAAASGVNRATVAAELRKLRADGIVRTSRGRIDIVDLAELRTRANE